MLFEIGEGAGLDNLPLLFSDAMSNAMAVTDIGSGMRYIFYDPAFLASLVTKSGTAWAAKFVLAHELGHHAEGHTVVPECSYRYEYQADAFAARVLYRLGADVHETTGAMEAINDPTGECHPSSAARKNEIISAWNSERMRLAAITSQYETAARVDPVAGTEEEDPTCGSLIDCLIKSGSPDDGLQIKVPVLVLE